MFTWGEIAALFGAVWGNTVSLLSGIIGLIVVVIGLAWPKAPQKQIWIICALVAFFLSLAFAWRDKHRELMACKERLKSPELEGDITGVLVSEVNRQDTVIFVALDVVNPFGPPSAVLNWDMTVETGSRTFHGEARPLSGGTIFVRVPEGQLTFRYGDYGPGKMMQPIPAGGVSAGWFWSTFRGIQVEELYKDKAMVVVSFSDVIAGRRYRLKKHLEPGSHIPGLFTQQEFT